MDEDRLRAERANRHSWKSRVTGLEDMSGPDVGSASNDTPRRRERPQRTTTDDDLEYRLALEASKNEAEEEARRRANRGPAADDDDDDLAKALKLSKEEDELRELRRRDAENEDLLFDDTPSQQPQPTGLNQGYQQQAAVDWFGNPVDHQQPQSTGYLNNAYGQPTGLQPQQTAFQNGYGYQPTGYDAFGQQPQQQQIPQATGYNPWASQPNGGGAQQPQQQQAFAQSGTNNPWGSAASHQELAPQPTGSNNPFASRISQQQQPNAQRAPTLSALQEQKTAQQFQQQNSYNPILSYQAPPQQQPIAATHPHITSPAPHVSSPLDTHRAQLNALLASGEGLDTFGNVGNTRIPAQHTAPGTFVNSAGTGMGRLEAARTGASNPFIHNQFTGAPQQHPQQFPAQTGPVQGSSNPFGRPQQGGQGGSLIDL